MQVLHFVLKLYIYKYKGIKKVDIYYFFHVAICIVINHFYYPTNELNYIKFRD